MADRRSPFTALLLSIILPGLGQLYNREATKGWVIFGSCLSLGLLSYWISGLNKISTLLALLLLWINAVVDAYKAARAPAQASDFYYRRPYVVAMLLLIGPLALPLLWQSPNFSRSGRWIWTFIVVSGVLLFLATPYLMNWLIRQVAQA
jgi:TM2 domain-containing membrane protein YozV